MNILVTGANGQLGSEIKSLAPEFNEFNFFFTDFHELDICNRNQLDIFFSKNKIEVVINCAAYTSVDKAETDQENAEKVNITGVENLVREIKKTNGKLIHISTDYVFSGDNFSPYTESCMTNPIGVYGETKRKGELVLINSNIEGIIIRTSWLYSVHGNNFLNTILRISAERESIDVVSDQIGTPTYANDLAKICLEIISKSITKKIDKLKGIYHYSNEGVASWYDFAHEIMQITDKNCKINPIKTKDFLTPASRPYYSVLDKTKIKSDFRIIIPHWKDSLKKCMKQINNY